MFLVGINIAGYLFKIFFFFFVIFFYKFEGRGHKSLIASSEGIIASLIQVSRTQNPLSSYLNQNDAKMSNRGVSKSAN